MELDARSRGFAGSEAIEVDVPGGTIICHARGVGSTLLLLHPTVTDSRVWGPQLQELSGSYRLIAVDQRGHGQSSVPGESYDPVADAAAVLAATASNDVVVIALGDAAQVALRLAIRTDVTVRAVVLATPGVGSLISDDPEFDPAAEIALAADDPARDAVFVAASAGDRDETARLLGEEPRALPAGHPSRVLFREMTLTNIENVFREATLDPWDDLLANLRAPTLIVTNESPAQRLAARALRRHLTADLVEIKFPTKFDLVNLDLPEMFNAAVVRFLDKISVPPAAGA